MSQCVCLQTCVLGLIACTRACRSAEPNTHVCGHTHWDISTTIGGVHYLQKPLGYPKERTSIVGKNPWMEELRRISIQTTESEMQWGESPPLARIWGNMG